MITPKRIQRQRTKGWRMPENTVYVGRPTKWGNPWKVGERIADQEFAGVSLHGVPLMREGVVEDPAHAVDLFGFWLLARVPFTRADARRELAGLDLACWCPLDQPCHADVLLAIANGGQQ